MGASAHYLEIEWDSPGVAKRVEVSTHAIALERGPNGTLHAEFSIFRDFAPWLGLQLSDELGAVEPATIDAKGDRHPWLAVPDVHGATWWIPATGWSKDSNRHLSEMYRSFGEFNVELGPHLRLVVDAVSNELDRAHAQEYLDDFRDELVWLAIGRPTGAMGDIGADFNRELIEALGDFADAAARVLDHPAHEIREVTAPSPASRLRPNAETFRAIMRRPAARRYPGRVAEESADIPENRYLRGMIQHCQRLASSLARSSSRNQDHLAARSAREKARAAELLSIEQIDVDPEVFDNQLADIQHRIDAIVSWKAAPTSLGSGEREYSFSVGDSFKAKGGGKEFFYRNLNPNAQHRANDQYAFSVACLPDTLHDLVMEAKSVDKELSLKIRGEAAISSGSTPNRKAYRRATFTRVSTVRPNSPVLSRRIAARSRYEREGWNRPISSRERQEYRAEAKTALSRASEFDGRMQNGALTRDAVTAIEKNLGQQDAAWGDSRVRPSSTFPMGMKFVQNPTYAAALAAFHRLTALEQRTGIGGDVLERLGRINVLHASALYERWCLIKIIAVLIEDFNFIPQADWIEHVVTFSAKAGEPGDAGFRVLLERSQPSISASLDVEPILANGRRPDFRLRFTISNDAKRPLIFSNIIEQRSGLVMDAKFRTKWKRGELSAMLTELVDTKDYGQDGDRVFILHPAKGAIAHRTSPLGWSRDCDYGQDHPTGHRKGSIQLGADLVTPGASTLNLRRLIALELQEAFPEPEFEKVGRSDQWDEKTEVCRSNTSLCIACGKAHESEDVVQRWTEGGNPKWFYRCSGCGAETMRTHCFAKGCGTDIFKNGLQMTYHLTKADQITNIVCQNCGANF